MLSYNGKRSMVPTAAWTVQGGEICARLGPKNHIQWNMSCHMHLIQVTSNDPRYYTAQRAALVLYQHSITSKLKHLLPAMINLSCRSDQTAPSFQPHLSTARTAICILQYPRCLNPLIKYNKMHRLLLLLLLLLLKSQRLSLFSCLEIHLPAVSVSPLSLKSMSTLASSGLQDLSVRYSDANLKISN